MSTVPKTWLHSNRGVLRLGAGLLLLLFAISVGSAVLTASEWLRWAAVAGALVSAYAAGLCIYLMRRPRLSFLKDKLHVRLRPGPPIEIPIDVVECFFLGQGPTLLPRPFGDRDQVEETSTIVVRLAESAEEWKHFDVKPALGLWCDGYITIRGTWCEPITNELLKRLNDNLVAAHRKSRESKADANVASGGGVASRNREQEVG